MAKIIKKIPMAISGENSSNRKRVLVFCLDKAVGNQVKSQLEKKNLVVWLVGDEKKLLVQLDEADPELIFIEVNATTTRPIAVIVAEVFKWMRTRARAINKFLHSPSSYLWEHSKIILFKSDSELTATGSLAADMADTDDIVRECALWGDVKYVGLYSTLSFMTKIRPFLE